jgi:hypothetical protein
MSAELIHAGPVAVCKLRKQSGDHARFVAFRGGGERAQSRFPHHSQAVRARFVQRNITAPILGATPLPFEIDSWDNDDGPMVGSLRIDMANGNEHGPQGPKEQNVQVKHLGEMEVANFKVVETVTLQGIWDEAYVKLDVQKADRDVFQAEFHGNTVSMMDHLGLTLAQAQQQNLCDKKFEIAVRTGGA